MDTEDDPLLQDAWLEEEDEEVAFSSQKRPEGALLCGKGPCRVRPLCVTLPVSGFWNIVGWLFTNPYCAGFILFLGCAIPAVLAVVMFLHYPALDIDISYNAFEIRNHESSQRFDALASALRSQFGSWGRNRRDLADFTSETLQRLIFQQLQQLHLNAVSYSEPLSLHPSLHHMAEVPGHSTARTPLPGELCSSHASKCNGEYVVPVHEKEQCPAVGVFLAGGAVGQLSQVEDESLMGNCMWAATQAVTKQKQDVSLCSSGFPGPPCSLEGSSSQHPSDEGQHNSGFPLADQTLCLAETIKQDLTKVVLPSPAGSLELAMTHPEFYWYVDEGLSAENMKSSLLRSEILFGAPLPNYYSVEDRWEEQRRKFQNFVITYVAMLAKQSTSKVQVLYGGTDLFDYEVRKTFNNDMLLAFISSSCIAVLVYVLTSCSVFLSFFGIASIGLSCLVALFLYHVVFGIQYLGILNGVAAFVIVGIGVDDVFVFINTYRQATHLQDLRLRMIHTIQTAGKATFFTSLTTAAAYAANIFSQIPAVHDFGLFMSLIVSCCWVAVLFTMPAALGIWTLYVSPLESSCQASCSQKCTKKSALHLAEDLFIASEATSRAGRETLPYLDDDIPLLSVEEEPVSLEMGDVPLVSVMPENLQLSAEKSNRGHLITRLQELLEHWVLWSAVKSRWVIVGLFLLVLLLSIFFASRLHPASRAPVLFRPDTNIQVLLDLKYNLSAEGISCITCSGLFQEKPHSLQNNIRTSLEKKKRGSGSPWGSKGSISDTGQQDLQGTVYISKSRSKGRPAIYRFSLNASVPAPWQMVSPGDGEVPSFQVYRVPFGNFTRKLTACVSTVGLLKQMSPRKWMMTTLSCDTKKGWKFDFSFYVASKEQQRTRKLYFAQSHKPPYHGRVCEAPPGCLLSSSPDGPTKGILYVPSEKAPKAKLSAMSGFNPCMNAGCGKPAVRPLVDTGAMVFVVFGIRGVNRTRRPDNHVIGDMGSVIYDDSFDLFKEIGNLCRLCKAIASNSELVKPGGAQCLPSGYSISSFLQMLHPECKNIPEPNLLPGQLSHGAVGVKDGKVQWISMAFESTTYKGKSSFQTYADYLKWETFLQQQLQLFPEGSALRHGFQTCEHWKQIFMEIIGNALYGLVLSLVICVAAVAVFTTHILLLLPVLLSILGVVCLVVTIMYWSGWEMGAVEAISLSILVGSSVDYCVHLVEGYLLAGENLPLHQAEDPRACRQWRTVEAVRHVGVAIVSSAVTTVIATVPLFFCIIAPFAKFGKIVALNTAVSIVYTLTVSTALLSTMAPGTFTRSSSSCLKAALGVLLAGLLGLCVCLALRKSGVSIPLPDGTAL
ncbi:DISP3 protein, partial [Climacteris rufus]|nr:DISP3 protein [Climacteris rufus]